MCSIVVQYVVSECFPVYLCSRLHQLQLKPIWEVTHGPQLENWRHAENKENSEAWGGKDGFDFCKLNLNIFLHSILQHRADMQQLLLCAILAAL